MLGVRADLPRAGRRPPSHRHLAAPLGAVLDPAPAPPRLLLVWRVADDDGDGRLALDPVRLLARLADRLDHGRERRGLGVGVGERVGEEHGRRIRGGELAAASGRDERLHLRDQAELRHRERPELQLEAEQPCAQRVERGRHGARPAIGFRRLRDVAHDAEHERPGPRRRIADRHVRRSQPLRFRKQRRVAQRLVGQSHHRGHDLGRRVVGPRLTPQLGVVVGEEVLVEEKPCFRIALGDGRPVDHVQNARQGAERCRQCLSHGCIVDKETQGGADQRVGRTQLVGSLVQTLGKPDAADTRDQKPERDRLRVTVREGPRSLLREQQLLPLRFERGQSLVACGLLLQHCFAQEAAEPGRCFGELLRVFRRLRRPGQEARGECFERRRSLERLARGFDVSFERDDLAFELAVLPQRKGLPVAVDQVRQSLQLLPLRLVVSVLELARIGTLARRLELNMTDKRAAQRDRVVRPGLKLRNADLADGRDGARRLPRRFGQVGEQRFERRAQLVFRVAGRTDPGKLRLEARPELRYGIIELHASSPDDFTNSLAT